MRYLVIGAAGHAQEVAWSLREQSLAAGGRCELAFFDDAVAPGPLANGLGDVVGPLSAVKQHLRGTEARLVLGIGLPRTKVAVAARLGLPDDCWTAVVHPTAVVGPGVSLGAGAYVGPAAVLTVNVRVGRFATINTHCLAAHGDVLGDFSTLHPDAHLSGEVRIGTGAEIGAGATIIPGVAIGAWAVLGAGCVAVRDLAGEQTWVGVPARRIGSGESAAACTEIGVGGMR